MAPHGAVALEVDHPDNLELDADGRLWIASPVRSEIVVFDPATQGEEKSLLVSLSGHSEHRVETRDVEVTFELPLSGVHKARYPLTLTLENVGEGCTLRRVSLYHYEFEGEKIKKWKGSDAPL